MDLNEVMRLPTYHRRTFLTLVTLIVVALTLLDIFILADERTLQAAASGVVRNIIAGVVTAVIVIAFVQIFLPKGQHGASLTQVPPLRITREFDKLLENSVRWHFQGNFGRNLRTRVLPALAKRRSAHVCASILDPSDLDLCYRHACFRNETPTIDGRNDFTAEDVACKALTTVLVCGWYNRHTRLSIDLWIVRSFSPIRIDCNDHQTLITVEDRRAPALLVSEDNFLFDYFMSQLVYGREQGRKVNLGAFPDKALADLTVEDLKLFVEQAGLPGALSNVSAEAVLTALGLDDSPYARS